MTASIFFYQGQSPADISTPNTKEKVARAFRFFSYFAMTAWQILVYKIWNVPAFKRKPLLTGNFQNFRFYKYEKKILSFLTNKTKKSYRNSSEWSNKIYKQHCTEQLNFCIPHHKYFIALIKTNTELNIKFWATRPRQMKKCCWLSIERYQNTRHFTFSRLWVLTCTKYRVDLWGKREKNNK